MSRAYSWVMTAILKRWAIVVALLLISFPSPAQKSGTAPKRVLILYSFDNDQGIYKGFDRVLRSQIRMRVRDRVEFYTEYLDLVRFPDPAHAQDIIKLLKLKYAQQEPDLIIPVSYLALQFLVADAKELFPMKPVVALFNQRRIEDVNRIAGEPWRSVTGVASSDDPARTLELALQLQPETRHAAVVVGSSSLEQYWAGQLKQDLSPYSGRVDLLYLTGLPISDLLRKLHELPQHSVVLSTFFFQDATGQNLSAEELLDLIEREAHLPVYGIYTSYIGHGVVGGRMTDSEKTGRKVADLAVAVLNGEYAGKIPLAADDSAADTVDWRQLQLWKISESRVPPGTMVLFRELSFWERYHSFFLAVISLCVLEAILIMALVLNVRRRRQAEKGLLREKTLADAVIEGLPGVFVLQDSAGKNIRWNRNAETIARYSLSKAGAPDHVVDEDKERVMKIRREVFEKGSAHGEAGVLMAGDKTAPYYFTGVRVELENKPYMAAVGIDVTEQKKAQQALQRSEAEMRSLVDHAPYGIATISARQDRFLRANPAMVKLLGYKSEAEVLRLSVSRDLYAEANARGFLGPAMTADSFSAVEFTWKRKDGKAVMVRASGRRIRDTQNEGDLIEIIAEDLTARRLLEEQLRQAQKLEALGQLSGSVAHDFNNLLSVIIGYSELMSANRDVEAPMKTHLETIKRAGERAASLTAQLLAFSRRQVLQPSVINLNTLVRETEKMLRRLMGEDVEHNIVLDAALWKTKADPGQMVQVIMNLAINARDAMPRGGTLSIETANVRFENAVTLHAVDVAAGNYVKLSVRDTGIGMDRETMARIFEPFFTTKDAGRGTGLGLATVYGIVKQSGGYIFADSEVGKGATFSIYLPQYDSSLEAPFPAERDDRPQAKALPASETLLVVEDEAAFRDLLRDGLQARGYQVLVAANGVDALRVAERHDGPIRLLVTDVIMPQMSGPELASSLRKVRPGTEVLYMSGYTDDKVRDLAESNELTLMHKPFYVDDLAKKIREILAGTDGKAGRVPGTSKR